MYTILWSMSVASFGGHDAGNVRYDGCMNTRASILLTVMLGACAAAEPDSMRVSTEGLGDFYTALRSDAEAFGYAEGDWTEDYGDAAAFGPTYYTHVGLSEEQPDDLARADEAAQRDLDVVRQGTEDLAWLAANLEEVFMAVQGAITWAGLTDSSEAVADIDALIDVLDPIVRLAGDYMEVELGEFASNLYGPTSVTGGVAVIYLQHAHYLDAERSDEWLSRAAAITETIDTVAREDNHYRFAPDVERLHLYPNAIMMLVLCRLYEHTGDAHYLRQAEQTFEGIQPLWDERMELYRSPYSEVSQGAQTDEYSTLSSQNYLIMGLMELYKHTGDAAYRDEVVRLLQSIRERLYSPDDGLIVHHWIDGRPAHEGDKTFFCSGCNLQVLFILWYLESVLDVPLR